LNEKQKRRGKHFKSIDKNKTKNWHAILILGCSSYSAGRAVHFWLILSLREHQRAFLGSKAKKTQKT
jgi:hypothetical protein